MPGARAKDYHQCFPALDRAKRSGTEAQKKSLHAAEQDTERIRAQRDLWREAAQELDPERLVFVDESGVTTEMTRRYGRGPRGERVREGVPVGRWRTLTVLGAVSTSGWVATMSVEAATDRDVFLAYLEHVLCPQLKPGQLVVMDNLAAHKVDGVRQFDRERRCRPLLPAALLSRLQSHRAVLGTTQTETPQTESPLCFNTRKRARRSPLHRHSPTHLPLLPPLRLRTTVIMKML